MTIAAITGLEAEARIARRAGLAARASGGIAAGTIEAAEACLAAGAEGLVSFGIAGALAPHLAPGSLVLPRVVVETDGARHDVDENWRARVRDRLIAAGLGIDEGDILGAAEAIATVERKAALHVATGAVAVDLESHIVARAARHSARPFWCCAPSPIRPRKLFLRPRSMGSTPPVCRRWDGCWRRWCGTRRSCRTCCAWPAIRGGRFLRYARRSARAWHEPADEEEYTR